ncbi:transposase [Streptococcus thermophilus]|nr:Transposase [Streptococcus thermophilus CNCM I-1630]CAD0157899.1 transposase [Streptococcus thermophilus]
MKLTYEDKVQIYELRKQGQTFNQLSKRFGVDASGLRYMTRLIERYGIEIIKKGKHRYDSPELKQEMIDKVLLEGRSQKSVSLDYCLSSGGMLPNWIAQYKKMGILFLRKEEGEYLKWGVNQRRNPKR